MKDFLESSQGPNQKFLRRTATENNKRKLNDDHHDECDSDIIKRIRLENVMCHSEFEPNSNVDVIRGENGKSSVLEALVLGPLSDSKYTKRNSNIGSFVEMVNFKDSEVFIIKAEDEDQGTPFWKEVRSVDESKFYKVSERKRTHTLDISRDSRRSSQHSPRTSNSDRLSKRRR